jgi:hypothetical protein
MEFDVFTVVCDRHYIAQGVIQLVLLCIWRHSSQMNVRACNETNLMHYLSLVYSLTITRAFFLGGRRGTRTLKHFVNLTGESKNFKMLDFPLNKLQILSLTAFIFSYLNYKVVIFLSQTESIPKHFFRKKALTITILYMFRAC